MSGRNYYGTCGWYIAGVVFVTTYLSRTAIGFTPSKVGNRIAQHHDLSLAQRDAQLPNFLHQKHTSSVSLSRRMSVAIDNENAVNGADTGDDENGDGSGQDIYTIRRTAAMVTSIAVQKIIPGIVQAGSMAPVLITDGFVCDFEMKTNGFICDFEMQQYTSNDKNEYEELKARIKEEVDSIVASKLPIVMESISIKEAKEMAEDNEMLRQRIESMDKDDSDTIMVCRIGEDWCLLSLCDSNETGDTSIVLGNTGDLDPDGIALTSLCGPDKENDDSDEVTVIRLRATAWETKSELTAYKTRVEESSSVVKTFGQLVNWGSGSLDDLDYLCACCNIMGEETKFGLNGLGLPPVSAGPNGNYGPGQPSRAQTRLTKESGPKIDTSTLVRPSLKLDKPFVMAKNPEWLAEREAIYDTIRERREEELAMKPVLPIEVTLPDGTVLGADHNLTSWRSTPMDVARCISDGLANVAVVARVRHTKRIGEADIVKGDDHGFEEEEDDKPELWDLTRPLEGDCDIEILTFNSDDEAAKMVFWHSSAHILGQSLEHNYGALLTIGPPVAGGFYYDAYLGDGQGLSDSQFGEIEDEFRKSTKRKEKFERLVVTKDEALELFSYSPFKTALIEAKVPDNTRTTVYRNGDLIDLCMGPHVPHTGKIKAFKILRASAASWLGDANNDQLQRVYGVSFPTKKLLKAHLENLERAKERDHRKLGVEQKLFMFHKLSPGSAFFLPHGTIIYNTLTEFIRTQYNERGYSEVVTPNVFNLKLWEQSGHAQHYKEDMFTFDVEGEEWGMKPMNCPAHCLMFGSTARSYRELPMRIADFGVLHRNEASGALTGLTRVRRFQQDDAHIFCREDQIADEVVECLEFMKFVYGVFGMTYKLELSTKPTKALGKQDLWDKAEAALAKAMNQFAGEGNWRENPGDGAFYGPKIDIKVMDAMDRVHQCATIQLDFQLPIRFDLRYRKGGVNGDGDSSTEKDIEASSDSNNEEDGEGDPNELPPDFARPVMVHRAMLGSVERMFAVLLEHYGGKWPFWLSPRQALIVPVGKNFVPYGNKVMGRLKAAGFHVDIDDSSNSLKKKVREGQLAQYNYILVVGEKEETNDSVAVRNRNNEMEGEKKVDEVIAEFQHLVDTYATEEVVDVETQ